MFYYALVFFISRVSQVFIPLNYDKQIMSNIIVRLFHSLGSSYYLINILCKQEVLFLDVESSNIPDDIEYVLTRSANYFIWDTFSLLVSNEEDKYLYILHHLISCLCISYSLYFEINWYFVSVGLFIAELTNPITQISEACSLFNYYSYAFEKFYFLSMLLIRGILSPCLLVMNLYQSAYLFRIHGIMVICNMSLIINYFTITSITLASIGWLNDKYEDIIIEDTKRLTFQ
tara:strand:+ start:176 stop:868 length:693 start_codon:yes stop_codon:yes gene_type:complete